MKNRIQDLRDHLFAELERLGDESLDREELEQEIQRAQAIAAVAREITETAKAEIKYMALTGQEVGTPFWPEEKGFDRLRHERLQPLMLKEASHG